MRCDAMHTLYRELANSRAKLFLVLVMALVCVCVSVFLRLVFGVVMEGRCAILPSSLTSHALIKSIVIISRMSSEHVGRQVYNTVQYSLKVGTCDILKDESFCRK